MNRDFKGIWLPREIWLSPLSCIEKCLWAEIHSLFDRESGGCYATNEYLANFLGVKERRLQEMMANLKYHGWVVQVSFDGRSRILKAIIPPEDFKPEDGAEQRCRKVHQGGAEKCTPAMQDSAPLPLYREQSLDTILDTPPIPPQKAADAAGADEQDSPKHKREKPEFSPKVREVANQMINLVMKYETTYRAPKDLTQFLKSVHEMVEEEKQDMNVLMKSFEWAVSDNEKRGDFGGWRGVVCTNIVKGKATNPAKQFHRNLTKINSARQSQPKRKFAPSSDDDKALAIMQEMSSRAI